MKKITVVLLVLSILLSLTACSSGLFAQDRVFVVNADSTGGMDFDEKIGSLDIDNATISDLITEFGEPKSYVWDEEVYKKSNLPDFYIAVFSEGFHAFIVKDEIMELRLYDSGFLFDGIITVGSTLEEVVNHFGEPKSVEINSEIGFEDGVLYRDISGDKGSCYLARLDRGIRMFFDDYKIVAMYLTRKDFVEKIEHYKNSTPMERKNTDDIDLPFVNDTEIIGKWESVDFVKNVEDFNPNRRTWRSQLYLKEMEFHENGKSFKPWWTWTKGVIMHKGDKTASQYIIKEIDGTTYMFFEWKSGDYVYRDMKPYYYVLKKVEE